MILTESPLPTDSTGEPVGRITLRPNNSLSWKAAKYFIATLMTVSFTIATGFLLYGMWMILLFTTLEMGVLSACFYYCARQGQRQEVVTLSREHITYEAGYERPQTRLHWQRFFTKILIHTPSHPWQPMRILLNHRGDEQEIGGFLSTQDKLELARALRQLVDTANRPTYAGV